jgi:transketolase N-terminal domain/subunit
MERIVEISYNNKLSHIGSCLMTYPILEHIYSTKQPDDIVVLSSGHAGLAQYVIIEKTLGHNAEGLYHKHGTHPHRSVEDGIYVSSGSLGSAILVAAGIALSNRNRNVYCIISDGECAEGSVWEALSFIQINSITNISIHVNINGYSAYDTINVEYLEKRLISFLPSIHLWKTQAPSLDFMNGLQAHYCNIKSLADKEELMNSVKTQVLAVKYT